MSRPPRGRSGWHAGQISLRDRSLIVEFSYTPERVDEIKRIPGARFEKATKGWRLPLEAYPALLRSNSFHPEAIQYTVSAETIEALARGEASSRHEAELRLKANPFAVDAADLEILELDVVIRLHPATRSLRAVPHFRSKAKNVIEKLSGAHYVRSDRSYAIATHLLPELLKTLRDRSLRFGVEAGAGEVLREHAALRAAIVHEEHRPDREELEQTLLAPYIVAVPTPDGSEERFSLRAVSTEQLRMLVPDATSFRDRRARAESFSEEELGRVLERAAFLGVKVWLSRDVHRFLEREREKATSIIRDRATNFPDPMIVLAPPPRCWAADHENRPGLFVLQEEFDRTRTELRRVLSELGCDEPLKAERDHRASDARFFPCPRTVLRGAVAAFDTFGGALPRSQRFAEILATIGDQELTREETLRFKRLRDVDFPEGSLAKMEYLTRLFPHQRVAVKWLSGMSRAFLADDMGLGKTLSVLTTFEYLRERDECDLLLVICPNSLTRNWIRESSQWFPTNRTFLLQGDRREKVRALKQLRWGAVQIEMAVVNYESARLDYVAEELHSLLVGRRPLLCLDESQRIKNPASKTYAALLAVASSCPRRILLSGTPTPKDLTDIWAQMQILDDGARFGSNYYDWLQSVAELGTRYSEYAVRKFKPGAVAETIARVEEVMLRRRKEEVINLPEKTFLVRDVELSGEQRKRYEEVRKDLLLRVSSLTGKSFVREITNVLEEYLRAVQVAVNPRLIDETWKGEPGKFQELDLLLDEIVGERGEKVVVWTNYLGNVRELVKRYERFGAKPFSGEVSAETRGETIRAFQNDKTPQILVAVPAAGGVGITLTAAQTAIYLDKTWNAEHWLQSVDRIHRIGQQGTVRIVSLHACGVDELISKNIARKAREQARLLGDEIRRDDLPRIARSADELLPTREELIAAVG